MSTTATARAMTVAPDAVRTNFGTFCGWRIATHTTPRTVRMATIASTSGEMRYWAATKSPSCTPRRRDEPRFCRMEATVNAMNGGSGTNISSKWAVLWPTMNGEKP